MAAFSPPASTAPTDLASIAESNLWQKRHRRARTIALLSRTSAATVLVWDQESCSKVCPVVVLTNSDDLAGRLTEWKHVRNSAGTEINRYTWSYDALGRPVTQTFVDGTSTFQFDRSSQVTGVTRTGQVSETYEYDSNGNRTNTGTSNGTNNRLLSDDIYDYQYDAEWNRTKRTDRATGQCQSPPGNTATG